MAYVITSSCVGCLDAACVEACPVDCIAGPVPLDDLQAIPRAERGLRLPGVQLFIEADVCICCGACAAVCPASAIYPDDDLPLGEQGAIELARVFFAARSGP